MKEKTKAYMAGIMDAEGCLGVYGANRDGRLKYQPVVAVTNRSLLLMKWITKHFGGNYRRCHWSREGCNSSEGFEWSTRDQKHIDRLLRSFLPYLVLKKEQTLLILEYVAMAGEANFKNRKILAARLVDLKQERVTTETWGGSSLDRKTCRPYVAGLMDGEGSFMIRKVEGGFRAIVTLGNTQKVLVQLVNRYFPGNTGRYQIASGPFYTWSLCRRDALERFALAMLPYLVVKREKAKLLLDFVRLSGMCPERRATIFAQSEQLKRQSELTR